MAHSITESEVAEKAKKIVQEHLGVEMDEIQVGSHFVNDLGADSLDMVEIVMAFEEEFDIEIRDEDADRATTFGTAVSMLIHALGKRAVVA